MLYIILSILLVIFVLIILSNRPITVDQAEKQINKWLENQRKKPSTPMPLLQIQSPKLNYSWGETNHSFHIASVGKTFTAALIYRLADKKLLDVNRSIAEYLSEEVLKDLFIYQGKDYCLDVTAQQLLEHSSGMADYFEDPLAHGKPMRDLLLENPERHWTPEELLDLTRKEQEAVGIPGESFHYSDSGYILLGLIVQAICKKPFHEVLKQEILQPLGMTSTYMIHRQPPEKELPMAPCWFEGQWITGKPCLTADWTGGGLMSTLEDLQRFAHAMAKRELLSPSAHEAMESFPRKYRRGIHYGPGVMEYHMEEYSPALKALPHLRGHMGTLGTQMLWDSSENTTMVLSLGSTKAPAASVKLIMKIQMLLRRIKEEK